MTVRPNDIAETVVSIGSIHGDIGALCVQLRGGDGTEAAALLAQVKTLRKQVEHLEQQLEAHIAEEGWLQS